MDTRVDIDIRPRHGGKSARLTFDPDTGAQVSVMPRSYLKVLGIDKDNLRPTEGRLRTFDGRISHPDGMLNATLTFRGKSIETAIWVTAGVKEALLSKAVALKLGIIAFPHHNVASAQINPPVLSKKSRKAQEKEKSVDDDYIVHMAAVGRPHSEIQGEILKAYADVFSDSDAGLRPMVGAPMKIALQEGAIPFAYHVQGRSLLDLGSRLLQNCTTW